MADREETAPGFAALLGFWVDPALRRLGDVTRRSAASELKQFLRKPPVGAEVRAYSAAGLVEGLDFFLLIQGRQPDDIQEVLQALFRIQAGRFVEARTLLNGIPRSPSSGKEAYLAAVPIHEYPTGEDEEFEDAQPNVISVKSHPSVRLSAWTSMGVAESVLVVLFESSDYGDLVECLREAVPAEAQPLDGMMAVGRRVTADELAERIGL